MHRAFAYLCQGDNPKDLFGKAWSKTREFWRSLEKAWRAPLFRHRWLLPPASSDRAGSSLRGAKLRSNPRVALVRKRRSNEAVRPAKGRLRVWKSDGPFHPMDRRRPMRNLSHALDGAECKERA